MYLRCEIKLVTGVNFSSFILTEFNLACLPQLQVLSVLINNTENIEITYARVTKRLRKTSIFHPKTATSINCQN